MGLSRREFLSSVGGLTALLVTGMPNAHARDAQAKFGVAGTVLRGDGSAPLEQHMVLINNGVIESIVPAAEVKDRRIISIPNSTIVPGIINCHCHRVYSADERKNRYLQHGVTSIGDAASPLQALPDLLHSPTGQTATASCAGPMLCAPGGYPLPVHSANHGLVVTSPDNGRETVRRLVDLGTTMIKIAFEPGVNAKPWPMLDAATAHAICDEARKAGLTIRCHVEDFSGLHKALEAGVHTVEHVPYRWMKNGSPRSILYEGKLIPSYHAALERMVRDDVILTPTLDVFARSMWDGPALYEPVRHFKQLGGRIALGNDHPYRRTEAGMPFNEMTLLRKAGLTPHEIITAGTQSSAAACGFPDRGLLAPGMKADLLIIQNDPLTNLDAIKQPTLIIKDGVVA